MNFTNNREFWVPIQQQPYGSIPWLQFHHSIRQGCGRQTSRTTRSGVETMKDRRYVEPTMVGPLPTMLLIDVEAKKLIMREDFNYTRKATTLHMKKQGWLWLLLELASVCKMRRDVSFLWRLNNTFLGKAPCTCVIIL